jgi:hypothetical protein
MLPLVQGERGRRPPRASLDGPMSTPGLETLSRGPGIVAILPHGGAAAAVLLRLFSNFGVDGDDVEAGLG